jgi:outer membrane protein assembly factor BamB
VIRKWDNKGTSDFGDDTLLDGASFSLYLDDGDEVFESGQDELISGPDEATGGELVYSDLEDGDYWVVEVVVPDGFIGTEPLLIPVDGDGPTCIFDRTGLLVCLDQGTGTSIVDVDNTPEEGTPAPSESASATPTGSGGGETGTPPSRTLPPTDALPGPADGHGDSWRFVLIAIAGLLSGILVLTPSRRRR